MARTRKSPAAGAGEPSQRQLRAGELIRHALTVIDGGPGGRCCAT